MQQGGRLVAPGFCPEAIPEKWLTIFTYDHETLWTHPQLDHRNKVIAKSV